MRKFLFCSIIFLLLFSCSKDEEKIEPENEVEFEQLIAGKCQYTKRFYINETGEENLSQDECSLMRSYTFFETGNFELEYWGGDGEGGCEIWEVLEGSWAVGKDPNDDRHNLIFQSRDATSAPLETGYAFAEFISENILHITFYGEDEDSSDFGTFKLHLKKL